MSAATAYFDWQSRLVLRELGRRVLEVGCGLGNFTEKLLDRDMVVAVDVEPDCVDRLKARYPNRANLQAFSLDASDPAFRELRRFEPDSCICLNVLEHIEDDHGTIAGMAANLNSGGVIVLIVPAFQALYGPIDRNLGHFRRYSRASVAALAKATGLRVRKSHYMNSVGFFGWWVNARISKREAQSEAQIRFFDKVIVPPMAWLEGLVKPWFGQSLFVVFEKP